jgi:hypothetical protein
MMKIIFDGKVQEIPLPGPLANGPQYEPYVQGVINVEAMEKMDLFDWNLGQCRTLDDLLGYFTHHRVRVTIEDLGQVDEEE